METTARFGLPLLAVAQAAKEMTVNEALTALDIAMQPAVESEVATPPSSPTIGQCWIVATAATGAFAGHDGAIAAWTFGGWRFVPALEGMTAWRRDDSTVIRRSATAWIFGEEVNVPTGGVTIDSEARAAIAEIRARLRIHGLIAV